MIQREPSGVLSIIVARRTLEFWPKFPPSAANNTHKNSISIYFALHLSLQLLDVQSRNPGTAPLRSFAVGQLLTEALWTFARFASICPFHLNLQAAPERRRKREPEKLEDWKLCLTKRRNRWWAPLVNMLFACMVRGNNWQTFASVLRARYHVRIPVAFQEGQNLYLFTVVWSEFIFCLWAITYGAIWSQKP